MPSTSPPAVVTPSALRWARESIGYTLEEAAGHLHITPRLLWLAEEGIDYLTMRQAEAAARLYERPLAALFLPEPPKEEPQEAQFRRLPGAPEPPWPPSMRSLVRRVAERQTEAVELLDLLDEPPAWPAVEVSPDDDAGVFGARVRDLLGVDLAEQYHWRDGYTALRAWVDAIEALGILVVQDGTVPIDLMRGFAATHDVVPVIVLNTNDDPRARAFTAVHELAHLFRRDDGPSSFEVEDWCSQFAGAVIAPPAAFRADFANAREHDLLATVDALALQYSLTPLASAVRVARLGLAPQAEVDETIRRIRRRPQRLPSEGGNYYRTMLGRNSPAFVQLVFAALDSQAITYPLASGLLRVKVNNFAKFRDYAAQRMAR
ncbi:MAG TPA: ImmA/IrrE family metallo-endopeptidase [Gaiellaceae bacterium]|nr:ImmA/IrrE family metallo-endopeptidase [Gaiellaceae bacterium]